MESIDNLLEKEYWGNSLQTYLITLGVVLATLLVLRLLRKFIVTKAQKWVSSTDSSIDNLVVEGIKRFVLPIAAYLIIYWGISSLELSQKTEHVVEVATAIVIAFFIIRLISTVIKSILVFYISKQENGEAKIKQITGLMIIINIVIWVLGLLFLLDNLGYEVSTILTGVGIGGIAIAFAAQNIIGDLFNYFVIFFDKPFEVGDAINVDDKNGTIEYIGLKTTRLRSLSGEQIVISNSDLTKSRVHNFKRQDNRRVQFNISVIYRTDTEVLRRIPVLVKEIIEGATETKFDRAHFARFTEYGLVFEVVYFVLVADYLKYMDIQQDINLKLMEIFKREKIDFLIREDRPGEWDNNTGEKAA